ncbi:MAG: hypothetical protein AAGB34_08840, partial [Planctomycetota bacterium]
MSAPPPKQETRASTPLAKARSETPASSANVRTTAEIADLAALWPRIIEAASQSAGMSTAIKDVTPGLQSADTFELKLFNSAREKFVRSRLSDIQQIVEQVAGRTIKIRLAVERRDTASVTETKASSERISEVMEDPLVQHAVELFEGRIVE